MRQKGDGVVKAMSEENYIFDIALNEFIFLSVHAAFTFGGFLETSFQSAVSALSNYSNYELLLSDRTEVLHKIFHSRLCQILKCPLSRPEYEGWVTEVVPVWIAYTKKCSLAGLGLHNEVQNCEEALKNETIAQVLMV